MINDNDFVLINFIGRVASSNKIFDLTYKDVAEKEGIHGEGFSFSPLLVIPSSNYVLLVISKSVVGKNVGDKYDLDVKAKDGFGEFNPKLIKTLGLSSFTHQGINPSAGDVVMLDNTVATVLSVSGGRVMVSFNHPLAGKDLKYSIEIVKTISDNKEKCAAIFEHYAGKQPESVNIEGDVVKISHKEKLKQYVMDAVTADVNKYVSKDFKVEITGA